MFGTNAMVVKSQPATHFHLHLVSDATGETLNAVAKATCAQFEAVKPIEHVYALVRSPRQLQRVLKDIEGAPGIVLYTMMNNNLRAILEKHCQQLAMPYLSVLDPVLGILGNYLGTKLSHKAGGQHVLNAEYFKKIDALNFTMAHDDGQNAHELNDADIVLLGVSRTSKTPTCIYLANRGLRTANVPIIKGVPLPSELDELRNPLVIGLTISTHRLVQVRRQRLISMKVKEETSYIDQAEVQKEIIFARRIFDSHNWPALDVSRRSIEETAAAIMNLFSEQEQSKEVATAEPAQ